MSLNLTTDALRSILSLSEKRDALLAELQKVETEISQTFGDGTRVKKSTLTPKTGKGRAVADQAGARGKKKVARRGKRGRLKEKILSELQDAGKAGVAIKDLATKLGVKNQNVHVWFATTGKTVGAKKIGPGRYAL